MRVLQGRYIASKQAQEGRDGGADGGARAGGARRRERSSRAVPSLAEEPRSPSCEPTRQRNRRARGQREGH